MKQKRFYWVYCLCLFGVAFGFTSRQDQVTNLPVLESSQIELLCSEHGIVKYRLFTDKALRYESGDCAYPEGAYIEFYESSNKEVSMKGRADSVYFFAQRNIYEFRGDVEIKNFRDATQLNTELLYWNPEHEAFHTDKFVRLETEEELLTGEGLTAKQDLSYYVVFKPQGLLSVK